MQFCNLLLNGVGKRTSAHAKQTAKCTEMRLT